MFQTKHELASQLKLKCSEARLQLLDSDAWPMRPVEEWPKKPMAMWLGAHIGHNERLQLVYFLAANQCPPSLIVQWAKAQPGWLRTDKSAFDMANLIKEWCSGAWMGDDGRPPKTAWNMDLQQVVPVETPNFAFEEGPRKFTLYDGDWTPGTGSLEKTGSAYMPSGKRFFLDAMGELRSYGLTLPRK
jgi:hypothetical protein